MIYKNKIRKKTKFYPTVSPEKIAKIASVNLGEISYENFLIKDLFVAVKKGYIKYSKEKGKCGIFQLTRLGRLSASNFDIPSYIFID